MKKNDFTPIIISLLEIVKNKTTGETKKRMELFFNGLKNIPEEHIKKLNFKKEEFKSKLVQILSFNLSINENQDLTSNFLGYIITLTSFGEILTSQKIDKKEEYIEILEKRKRNKGFDYILECYEEMIFNIEAYLGLKLFCELKEEEIINKTMSEIFNNNQVINLDDGSTRVKIISESQTDLREFIESIEESMESIIESEYLYNIFSDVTYYILETDKIKNLEEKDKLEFLKMLFSTAIGIEGRFTGELEDIEKGFILHIITSIIYFFENGIYEEGIIEELIEKYRKLIEYEFVKEKYILIINKENLIYLDKEFMIFYKEIIALSEEELLRKEEIESKIGFNSNFDKTIH